jgi:hypothetical protein
VETDGNRPSEVDGPVSPGEIQAAWKKEAWRGHGSVPWSEKTTQPGDGINKDWELDHLIIPDDHLIFDF